MVDRHPFDIEKAKALMAEAGAQAQADQWAFPRRDVFLDAAEGDDWIGVQNYTRTPKPSLTWLGVLRSAIS